MPGHSVDTDTVGRLAKYIQKRLGTKDSNYAQLMSDLLAKAQDENTHWRYQSAATRFIRALVRRDHVRILLAKVTIPLTRKLSPKPLSPQVIQYMMKASVSELPSRFSLCFVHVLYGSFAP